MHIVLYNILSKNLIYKLLQFKEKILQKKKKEFKENKTRWPLIPGRSGWSPRLASSPLPFQLPNGEDPCVLN